MWDRVTSAIRTHGTSASTRCPAKTRSARSAASTVLGRDETAIWARYFAMVEASSGARAAISGHVAV
jgi:hypothetical protein